MIIYPLTKSVHQIINYVGVIERAWLRNLLSMARAVRRSPGQVKDALLEHISQDIKGVCMITISTLS